MKNTSWKYTEIVSHLQIHKNLDVEHIVVEAVKSKPFSYIAGGNQQWYNFMDGNSVISIRITKALFFSPTILFVNIYNYT